MKRRTFIYHDTADQEPATKLRDYFKPLEQAQLLKLVLAGDVPAGADRLDWIREEIRQADIVLLVVTANLLASDLVYGDLARWIFDRRQAGKCVVTPVIFSKCRWDLTLFGKLEALPAKGAAIKSAYPSEDDGLYDVSEGVEQLLNSFDQSLQSQSMELEKLKSAIARFNFYEQLTPAAAPPDTGLFSVLVLKGSEKSGHQLLAWRWRTEIAHTPATARPIVVRLSETEVSADELSREIHRGLAGPLHDDARAYTPADVASVVYTRLQNEPLSIRLDDYNHLLQQEAVEDFFRRLQPELDRLQQKNPAQKPAHRLWFFLLHRSWSGGAEAGLNIPAKAELPPIGPVDAAALGRWQQEADTDLPAIARYRIACEQDAILLPEAADNEVLEVLDRLCEAVFAKTQLFDEYILKLE